MKKLLFIITLFLAATPYTSEAQILNRLQNKLEDKLADKMAEKMIEKMDSSTVNDKSDVPDLRPEYNFNLMIHYVSFSSDDKNDKTNMDMWFSDEGYIGMKTEKDAPFVVMDGGRMTTFQEKESSYMSISFENFGRYSVEDDTETNEDDNYTFEKIGTENILDYPCDVYKSESDENSARIWVTQSLSTGNMLTNFAALLRNRDLASAPSTGVMLKMISTEKESGDTFTMKATEVDKTHKSIKTSDYDSGFGF